MRKAKMANIDRRKAIEDALAEYESQNMTRTLRLEFRGQERDLKVIRINPQIPILNNNNSRLRAQLLTHASRDVVQTAPESEQAQQVIMQLLRATEDYKNLKEQIRDLGQVEAGVITGSGLLINGNTRLAAMRELNKSGFDVAVLPADATSEDLVDIELNLQLRKLVHQDYTFTNRLLMMKHYIDSGKTIEMICQKMAWHRNGKRKFEQAMRMLGYIEEVRALSKTPTAYSVFDTKEQHLKDLDEKYESLKSNGDIKAAETMKWTRLAALLLGVNKDQVRAMDEDFIDDQIVKRVNETELENIFEVNTSNPSGGGNPDHSALLGEDTNDTIDMRGFTKELLDSVVDPEGRIDGTRDEKYENLENIFRRGAEELIDQEKQDKWVREPSERLKEATLNFEAIVEKMDEYLADTSFNRGKFEIELRKLEKTLKKLKDKFD
jgi:hypothetical protein